MPLTIAEICIRLIIVMALRAPFLIPIGRTNITLQMTEGDILQIEERGLWIVSGLPRLLVLNGQIVDVFDFLAAPEAVSAVDLPAQHAVQNHLPQPIAGCAEVQAERTTFLFVRHSETSVLCLKMVARVGVEPT